MRFGVISDVHGNVVALRRVVAHLALQSVDGVINLGDCVSAPLWPQETFELLEEMNAYTVRGNHDRWLGEPDRAGTSATVAFTRDRLAARARETLVSLPATRLVGGEIFAMHGTPHSDTDYLLEDSLQDRLCLATASSITERLAGAPGSLALCGHSHQQNVVWAAGRRTVVNPGSVGCPRYAGNPNPRLNEGGSPHARYAVVTSRGGTWSVELFALEYDWAAVGAQARSVGRADWAAAFTKDA